MFNPGAGETAIELILYAGLFISEVALVAGVVVSDTGVNGLTSVSSSD